MRLRINFLKRITAMLLSGMLVIGLASGSVFASAIDIDPSQTSEVAEEAQAVEVAAEAFEAPENPNQTSEISEESLAEEEVFEAFEAPENSGQTSEISEESLAEEEAIEASEAPENPGQTSEIPEEELAEEEAAEADQEIGKVSSDASAASGEIEPNEGPLAPFDEVPDSDGAPAGDEALAGDEAPAGEEVPVIDEAPVGDEVLAGYETPAGDEASVIDEAKSGGTEPNEGPFAPFEEAVGGNKATGGDEDTGSEPDPNEGPLTPFDEVASGTCGNNLTWTLDDEGTLIISGTGQMTGNSWCDEHSAQIRKVTVENGVTNIADRAFDRCSKLTEVTIPESVTRIGRLAFCDCTSLAAISLPSSIANIGSSAFDNCNSLADVYYAGSKRDWNRISMSGANEYLRNAVLHCAHIINLNEAALSKIQSVTYNGRAHKPEPAVKLDDIALAAGVDYKVSYANNTHVGTATVTVRGINNFSGTKTTTFKINKAAQSITIKSSATTISVGETAVVSITGAKGKKSYKTSDKTIAAVDAAAGKMTAKKVGYVTITATSGATDDFNAASKTVRLKIVPAATASLTAANQPTGIRLTWKEVAGANAYFIFRDGTQIAAVRDGSVVTYTDKKANTNGTKYVYKIIASASVTGRSTHSKSVTAYRVDRPAISSLTNSGANKMTVKWGKNAKATGYQVQYCPDKTFKTGNKSATVSGASTVSKEISGLVKGKTYYVRIRTFKTVGSTKYFSGWSPVNSVKITK